MKRLVACIIVFCALLPAAKAKPSPDWWPMFGRDAQKTGMSGELLLPFTPPLNESRKNSWDITLSPQGALSAPMVKDGVLYVVQQSFEDSRSGKRQDGMLRAFSIDMGKLISEQTFLAVDAFEPSVMPCPAITEIGPDKIIVVGDNAGSINIFRGSFPRRPYKVSEINAPIVSSPTIDGNMCYIGGDAGLVAQFNLDKMQIVRTFKANKPVTCSPAIFGEQVLFGDNSGTFYSYNKDTGKEVFSIKPAEKDAVTINSSPCIVAWKDKQGEKTYAVFGSSKGFVHRVTLSPNGRTDVLSFRAPLDKDNNRPTFWATPSVVEGKIYIGADNGLFYRIDLETMKGEGERDLGQPIIGQAAYSNGYFYVCTASLSDVEYVGRLWTIDKQTFLTDKYDRNNFDVKGGSLTGPVIAGSYLFVTTRSGKIYRFEGARPILTVDPPAVNFGTIRIGDTSTVEISLINDGFKNPPLVGDVIVDPTDSSWLSVDKTEFETNNTEKLTITVDSSKIVSLQEVEHIGYLTVDTNAGKKQVEVRAVFAPDLPRIQLSNQTISFPDTFAGLEKRNMKTFTVTLVKGLAATIHFKPQQSWLECSPLSVTLSQNLKSIDVVVISNTKDLEPGFYMSKIQVGDAKSIANPAEITARVSVVERNAEPSPVNQTAYIRVEDCFLGKVEKAVFQFDNKGGRELTVDGASEFSADWISNQKVVYDKNSKLLTVSYDVSTSQFWPNQEYTGTINVTISGRPYTLTINATTAHQNTCKIEFFIDKKFCFVNGRQVQMDAAPFVSKTASTMVPIRYIGDPLKYFFGASIEWIQELKTVLFTMSGTTLRLIIDYNSAIVELPDGSINTVPLTSPAVIAGGRTFVPPRIIGETFGADVTWEGKTRKATFIFTSKEDLTQKQP